MLTRIGSEHIGESAIVVRWQWPEALATQAPEVDSFRIFLKEGWLNTYAGMISSAVTKTHNLKNQLTSEPGRVKPVSPARYLYKYSGSTFKVTLKDNAQFKKDACDSVGCDKTTPAFLF